MENIFFIEAVIFDMDGVLFDTERLYMEAWREIAAERGIRDIEKAAIGCVGLNSTDTKAFFIREYGEDFPFGDYYKACSARFHEKVEKDGLPLKPGVHEILKYLKSAGYRMGLASSTGRKSVLEHLSHANIKDYFEVIIGGDMVEHSKPQPDIYLKACAELSVNPQKAIAIEDSPNGIRSAYAAGMHPVMVPDMIRPTSEIEALLYKKCESLHEVREWLTGCKPEADKKRTVIRETVRIPLEGLCNTRDLGGYRSTDGRTIKFHKLIRSGALFESTAMDREILLKEYRLKTIVDFRTNAERSLKPDPALPGVDYLENPVLEEEALGITREQNEKSDGNAVVKKVISTIYENGKSPLHYMENMYASLVTNPFSRAQYRKFFSILLKQEEGAVLWHCSAGKDRVGVATLMLLSALSIPREQIIADYLKVNEFGKKEVDILMERLTEQVDLSTSEGRKQAEAVRLLFTVDKAYAESVFDAMEAECGSVDAFLEQEMGLTPDKKELLKNKYLEWRL